MYGPLGLGNNVAGIVFNMLVTGFVIVTLVGTGFLIYAAKELKKHENSGK